VSERGGDESKTEQPTDRRLAKAREEGSVVRAHAVASGAVLVTGAAVLSLAGARLVELLELCLRRGLSFDTERLQDPRHLLAMVGSVLSPGVVIIVLFLVALAAIGVAADILVGGWSFSARPLTPDFGRVNPLRGLQQLVSREAWVELVKALIKFAVVGAIAFYLIRGWAPDFIEAAAERWPAAADHTALLWGRVFLVLSASLVGMAALEVPYQLWAYRDRLKMTRQELKDELRELDGSPQTKRRIKLLRRRMARMRMSSAVPKADVVVTNPDHFSAALQYQENEMRAPRLVAKGTGLVAQRIREIAVEHGVPIIEAPPLARAICRYVELEDEIPPGLYPPVAEVLAYVYRLRAAAASGRRLPPAPQDQRFDPPPEFAA
jgi:flagellar biosynthesis protein FlhB